jgi:acetyl esterase/lipase
LADFAHRGYVVAGVEYRPSTEAQAPAQVQDVKAAIRYLRAHAARFNIDPAKVGIWGDSSGGHLAALVGTSDGVAAFAVGENLEQPATVQAVVDFYGPTDFRKMNDYPTRMDHDAESSPESSVVGGPIQDEAVTERVQAYNPITYVDEGTPLPPFLIMHGDKDVLVPFNQSVLLYTALRDAGHEVTFYKIKGADHGVRFWTPAVLEIVHAFFDRNLK